MMDLISFAIKGRIRRQILLSLSSPKTPNKIAKNLNTHLPTISRNLKELQDKNLVKCLNPKESSFRIYELTDLGKKILIKLKEIN